MTTPRLDPVWKQIVDYSRLREAVKRAAEGKRDRQPVARFLEREEWEILRLQRELEAETYRPGVPFSFVIHDPKKRLISAAPFCDRVVHHALVGALAPRFERRMLYESFACREGKGTHAALDYAQRNLRRYPWFLKLDIHHCFESLHHDVVLESAKPVVPSAKARRLLEVIVRAGGPDGVGLPIGALTSQWLTNLVLDRLDHHIKEVLRVPGYVRYMDDFVLFAPEKSMLQSWLKDVRGFVQARLKLCLKDRATLLAPRREGLPYLGWNLFTGLRRLRPQNLRRTRARLRQRKHEVEGGEITEQSYADSVGSVLAHLRFGQTYHLRKHWFFGPGLSEISRVEILTSSQRVNRGGSFNNDARNLRGSNRNRNDPANRNDNIGFRPALQSGASPDRCDLRIAPPCPR